MPTIDPVALRLAAIVESSDDAIISHDLNGVIETWNRAASRIFGYSNDEAIGRAVETLFTSRPEADHPDLLQRLRSGESIAHIQTSAVTKQGGTLPVSLSISPVLTPTGEIIGISRIVRDMSQQQRTERDALRLAAIIDWSDDAIISKDLSGIVQTWNRAAERMFGYTADEMIGESITRIIPAERYSEEETVLTRIRAGLPVEHFETVRQRKDGTLIDISLTVSPIRTPDGTIIGASKIARDISIQRELTRTADEASRVKDEFLATLSHELRTPLNAVLGYTRMLRTGRLGAERRERAIDVIERNAVVLHQLVSDVLDVSGIVTGKMRVIPIPCELSDVVRAACDSVGPTADTKGVAVTIAVPERPVITRCDPDRMQQVLWNLLSNAIKFTPRGGQVSVTLSADDRAATIVVKDTGIGLKPEALPHVFQRFWQGDSVNSRQTGGLGLGLALARHFVELQGGIIAVASDGPGTGATFTVTLPISPG